MELKEILNHVDHTLLKQDSTWEQIKAICDDGIEYSTASVCIPASFVKQAKKGVKLTIDFGAKVAKKNGVKDVSGAYILNIDKKGISIVGYDERGAFYGIQTLRQIFDRQAYDRESLCIL